MFTCNDCENDMKSHDFADVDSGALQKNNGRLQAQARTRLRSVGLELNVW